MKHFINIFFLCFCFINSFATYLVSKDSLKHKYYCELRAGLIIFSSGKGVQETTNDKLKSSVSESFNIGFGKRFNRFLAGFNVDFTKFNLTGQPKTVGYEEAYSNGTHNDYSYYINQKLNFYNLSLGFSSSYIVPFNKFAIDFGPDIYFTLYRSQIILSNNYVGTQPVYPNRTLPAAETNFKSTGNNAAMPGFPYIGMNLNFSYRINNKLSIKVFNSFFYNFNFKISGNTFGALPQQSIYSVNQQLWVNSGISLFFN